MTEIAEAPAGEFQKKPERTPRIATHAAKEGPRRRRLREPAEYSDDRHNHTGEIIAPLNGHAADEGLAHEFAYLSQTADLEVSSPRVARLQSIADTMLEGEEPPRQARIVIAKKGVGISAFVLPDGTTVISQSLLNRLDSMDEVAGVIGHELGHLILETHTRARGSYANRLSVGWLHEMANDPSQAVRLMEKAGFNTLAHASLLQKISTGGRDTEHMTGETRAATVVGRHMAVHTQTSSVPLTPLPPEYHHDVQATNAEHLQEIIKRKDTAKLRRIIGKLHPQDFEKLKQLKGKENKDLLEIFKDEIDRRLKEYGYSEQQRIIFRFRQDFPEDEKDFVDIQSPSSFADFIREADSMDAGDTMHAMAEELYGDYNDRSKAINAVYSKFVDVLNRIPGLHGRYPEWVSMDKETFVHILKLFNTSSSFDEIYQGIDEHGRENRFREVLEAYVGNIFIKNVGEDIAAPRVSDDDRRLLDPDQIKELYQDVVDARIPIAAVEEYPTRYLDEYTDIKAYKEQILALDIAAFGQREIEKDPPAPYDQDHVDQFFADHHDQLESNDFEEFIDGIQRIFRDQKWFDDARVPYIDSIAEKIDQMEISSSFNLLDVLENPDGTPSAVSTDEDRAMNSRLRKLNLKILLGQVLFRNELNNTGNIIDTDFTHSIAYLKKVMDESGIDLTDLSQNQLYNLAVGLFNHEGTGGLHPLTILGERRLDTADFYITSFSTSVLAELPLIQALERRTTSMEFASLASIANVIENGFGSTYIARGREERTYIDLFSNTDSYALILGQGIRRGIAEHIGEPITDDNLHALSVIADVLPNTPMRTALRIELRRYYISSPAVSFDQKLRHLDESIDILGFEAATLLADQIHTYADYIKLRDKMGDRLHSELGGSESVEKLALADVVTSQLTKGFPELLSTADTSRSSEVTTTLAEEWFTFCRRLNRGERTIYFNPSTQKFEVTQESVIDRFRSFSDILDTLRGLSSTNRIMIMMKALTDQDGALTSEESRARFADLAVNALHLNKGFIEDVIKATGKEIDASFGSFALAKMLAPSLFGALEEKSVDVEEVGKQQLVTNIYDPDAGRVKLQVKDAFSPEELLAFLEADSYDILEFISIEERGHHLKELIDGNHEDYLAIKDKIREGYLKQEDVEEADEHGEIDPGTEAILSGLASLGAPAVRSFQLARQFYPFSSSMERRLDRFFDQNQGLNTLFYWENLHTLAQTDTRLQQFLENDLVSLDETVGVGSLYTTRKATVKDGMDGTRQIVIKMLAPNAQAFVDQTRTESDKIFARVEKGGSRKEKKYIKTARQASDLSHEWCIRDINDTTYVEDDERFRDVITAINDTTDESILYSAPDQYLSTREIIMENFSEGRTINQILNDPDVSNELKDRIVKGYTDFFFAQFDQPPFTQEETSYISVLSNPSVGNCIVKQEGDDLQFSIIDRSLYLQLDETARSVLRPLIDGNYQQFLNTFLDEMLTGKNQSDRMRIRMKIGTKALEQRVRRKKDPVEIFRTVLQSLQDAGIEVPLEYRLTIGNIESMKMLRGRYQQDADESQVA